MSARWAFVDRDYRALVSLTRADAAAIREGAVLSVLLVGHDQPYGSVRITRVPSPGYRMRVDHPLCEVLVVVDDREGLDRGEDRDRGALLAEDDSDAPVSGDGGELGEVGRGLGGDRTGEA